MKVYIFIATKKRWDKNGNPKQRLNIYSIEDNIPSMVADNVDVGYMTKEQTVKKKLKDIGINTDEIKIIEVY